MAGLEQGADMLEASHGVGCRPWGDQVLDEPASGHYRDCIRGKFYKAWMGSSSDRETLAAPGAIAGTAAVRCDVAAPAITGAKLLRKILEHVTFTRRQL